MTPKQFAIRLQQLQNLAMDPRTQFEQLPENFLTAEDLAVTDDDQIVAIAYKSPEGDSDGTVHQEPNSHGN